MASSSYFSLLTILIILVQLARGEYHLFSSEEEAAKKYIADEDTSVFLKQLRKVDENYGRSWIVLPDGNGTAQYAKLQMDKGKLKGKTIPNKWSLEQMPLVVTLHLFTRKNPQGQILDPTRINETEFDSSESIKIICHGWRADAKSSVITSIRDAYLEEQNPNIIAIDWSPIAEDLIYPNPAFTTRIVGRYIANVIDTLVEEKEARYEDVHFIGHSLGAHIGGFTGSATKQKIGRITGLDPALPCFQDRRSDDRLDPSDANFVDVIHTCSGILGMSIPAGHADFYPNGGSPFQPGCCWYLPEACSHSRSHEFFAESIRRSEVEFKAVACQDWDHFKNNKCDNVYTNMGEYLSPDVRGVFYLKTYMTSPFALGMAGTIY